MTPTPIQLDTAAQALFDQLQSGKGAVALGPSASGERLDLVRMMLVDVAYHLSASFKDVQYWDGVKAQKGTFDHLYAILLELNRTAGSDGKLLIRYRGMPSGPQVTRGIDYVATCGDTLVDTTIVPGVIQRMGIRMSHLAGRLAKAFTILSELGVSNLYLRLPSGRAGNAERLRTALAIVSRYFHAVRADTPITFLRDGKPVSLYPVLNAMNQPDPNLTLVAGLNGISAENMQALVQKVRRLMEKSPAAKRLGSVYNAIFAVKSLKAKLQRPPVELNNLKWLMVEDDRAVARAGALTGAVDTTARPAGGAGGYAAARDDEPDAMPVGDFDPELFKTLVDKLDDPAMTAGLKRLAAQPLSDVDSPRLAERLKLAGDLLEAMERHPDGEQMLGQVVQQLRNRFGEAPDEAFDDVAVKGGDLQVFQDGKVTLLEKVHGGVARMVNLFKRRAETRKEARAAERRRIDFDQDAARLAGHFGVPEDEVRAVVELLRGCFDAQGRFNKAIFEKQLERFAEHEKKVFEILWQYLKQPMERVDRVAYLNALQLLVKKLQQPKKALRVLLADVFDDAGQVNFSDRNALMLCNLMVRKYNKELDIDIEITPEEVLLVQDGLDRTITQYAAWRLDSSQRQVERKIATLREQLALALKGTGGGMPLRYLLALEREIHIFFSLVGGETARTSLAQAAAAYGDPDAPLLRLLGGGQQVTAFLQHLLVTVRALGRVATDAELDLVVTLRGRESALLNLGAGEPRNQNLVRRVMDWTDNLRNDLVYSGR